MGAGLETSKTPLKLGTWPRVWIGVGGGLSFGLGAAATFATDNGPGSTALIAAGGFSLLLAAVGRLPRSVGIGSASVEWPTEDVLATLVESPNEEVRQEVRDVLANASPVFATMAYEQMVLEAIQRVLPAKVWLTRPVTEDQSGDAYLQRDGARIRVEAKYRLGAWPKPSLASLLAGLHAEPTLLVTSEDPPPAMYAGLPSTISIVVWAGQKDDDRLRDEVARLTASG